MNNEFKYENRQIIPRWLPFYKYNHLNKDNNDPLPINDEEKINLYKINMEWRENPSISIAIQLIATYEVLEIKQNKYYRDALKFLIKNDKLKNNNLLTEIIKTKIEVNNHLNKNLSGRKEINSIRKLLSIYPNNPIMWIDLSYYHLLEGNIEKAKKCINIALSLNNTNSFIIRSASRFYIHLEEPERALSIIRNSPSLFLDPVILSSEISTSKAFDIKTHNIKKAHSLINSKNFHPAKLSELNATLATNEFVNGKSRKGKQLLNEALTFPNENILAQVQFLNDRFDANFNINSVKVPCSFEVDCWKYYQERNYKAVQKESEKWFYFQPFSARPAILNSYIKTMFYNDYDGAIKILNIALKLSPYEFSLLNNKAFSLAKLGNTKEAEEVIKSININNSLNIEDLAVIKATQGLIHYKNNNNNTGYALYQQAVNIFKQHNNFERQCKATYQWALEENLFNKEESDKLMLVVKNLAIKYNIEDVRYVLNI